MHNPQSNSPTQSGSPTPSNFDLSKHPTSSAIFDRVRQAYDLDRLRRCRLVCVGAGGGRQFIEEMTRAGVGEQILFDPDVVSATNIATQQVYYSEIGRPKVECIAERLADINPEVQVLARQQGADQVLDREWEWLLHAPFEALSARHANSDTGFDNCSYSDFKKEQDALGIRCEEPEVTVLCGLTDDFEAQARINRLALHFGVPSLCAQVYREGRGAEITFTVPGVTLACHRCALSSRYKAYLNGGFSNDVTSHGTPIFSTTRLNALKGFLTLAILHHGTSHPRWGGLVDRIGNRNLVLLRLDPDIETTLGLRTFGRVFSGASEENLLFDEAIWRPQNPDNPSNGFPTCPDCGGSGDLRQARGSFADTREMRASAS